MLAPLALFGQLILSLLVVMWLLKGFVRLLGFESARRGVNFGAPGKVLFQVMTPVSLPVLFTLSVVPAVPAGRFFLFLRPPVVSPGGLVLPHLVVGPWICCLPMGPLELPWKIPTFLEFFYFPFYSPFSLPNFVFVIIVVDEWRCWKGLVKHPPFCAFVSIVAFLTAVVAIC